MYVNELRKSDILRETAMKGVPLADIFGHPDKFAEDRFLH